MAIGLSFTVKAQVSFVGTATNSTNAITNTSVDTCYYTLSYSYATISIQPVVTKSTGTMAGTSVLYKSVNGTNWVATGDTLTLTNVTTNTTVWEKVSACRYWRIITGGATTVTGSVAAKLQNSLN
jgi:hypothetical protein